MQTCACSRERFWPWARNAGRSQIQIQDDAIHIGSQKWTLNSNKQIQIQDDEIHLGSYKQTLNSKIQIQIQDDEIHLESQLRFLTNMLASFQTTERLFFVMEFVSGGDLFHHIAKVPLAFQKAFPEAFLCYGVCLRWRSLPSQCKGTLAY